MQLLDHLTPATAKAIGISAARLKTLQDNPAKITLGELALLAEHKGWKYRTALRIAAKVKE